MSAELFEKIEKKIDEEILGIFSSKGIHPNLRPGQPQLSPWSAPSYEDIFGKSDFCKSIEHMKERRKVMLDDALEGLIANKNS